MALESGIPTTREIEEQLQRMLASDRFRVAEKRSQFLAFVVKRALGGKKTPGHIIARHLFPEKVCKTPDEKLMIIGNDVRQTANNLRKTLKLYRAEEGREDRIVISLPEPPRDRTIKLAEGEAYTPTFAYSAMHSVAREIRLGNHHHCRGSLEDEEIALRHFANALATCPNHIDAALGMIESWCELYRWDRELAQEPRMELLPKAVHLLNAEWARGSTYWRLFAASGSVHFLAGYNSQAADYFEKAKALDRIRTESYQPYLVFLLYCGDKNEAVALSKLYVDAHDDDIRAYVNYAAALLMTGRRGDAEEVLERALTIDKSGAYARYLLAQLRIKQRRHKEALPHIEILKMILEHRSFDKFARQLERQLGRLPRHLRNGFLPQPASK